MRPGPHIAARAVLASVSVVAALACASCAADSEAQSRQSGARLQVATSTPLLADMVRNVAGPDVHVVPLIPAGKDPHTFEPSLRTVRDVAHADIAFANGLLLEPAALMDTLRTSAGGPVIEVADQASTQGATLLPLVENAALDALWLGLRVANAPDNAPVQLQLESVNGPGTVAAYSVSTFGTPQVLFNSADGIDPARDSAQLPSNAHTHVSWAFSKPGMYELRIGVPGRLEAQTFRVAVGINPPADAATVIDSGHLDISADFGRGMVYADNKEIVDPATAVLVVPSTVIAPIPAEPSFRFLGHPGDETYLLPQAVLGAHIHGEVDPHLWHNVANGMAYVDVIAEQLAQADPSHGQEYRERAAAYQEQLELADAHLRDVVATLPVERRHVVSTHHGFAYLEQGYGLHTGSFLSPNPAVEPSPRDVLALRRTIDNLDVPAVFVEPGPHASTQTLTQVAAESNVQVCTLYGDSINAEVDSYLKLIEHNAQELSRCLSP